MLKKFIVGNLDPTWLKSTLKLNLKCKWPGHTLTSHFASANDLILSLLHEKWVDLVQKAQYLLMPDNMAPDRIPPVRVGAFHPYKRTCNFLFCSHVCLHDACNNRALTFWLKHREYENRLDINIVLVQTLFCLLLKEISIKLQMETISMLMISAAELVPSTNYVRSYVMLLE